MGKDELLEMWKKQEYKLDKSLKTNELLIKKINYDKARQDFKSTLSMERSNLWAIPFVTIACLIFCVNNFWQGYLIPCFLLILIAACISFPFYFKRLKMLKDILKFNRSIKESLTKIYSYQSYFNRNKKYEYIFGAIFSIPVLYIVTFNNDRYQHNYLFIVLLLATVIVVSVAIYLGYKHYYTKKLKDIVMNLKEIEEFDSVE